MGVGVIKGSCVTYGLVWVPLVCWNCNPRDIGFISGTAIVLCKIISLVILGSYIITNLFNDSEITFPGFQSRNPKGDADEEIPTDQRIPLRQLHSRNCK